MKENLVICSSRHRYANVDRLVESFFATASDKSDMLLVLDDDDHHNYKAYPGIRTVVYPRTTFLPKMNRAAAENLHYKYITQADDDIVFVTEHWDLAQIEALEEMGGVGLVHANDLHNHGPNMPTQPCLTTNMVEALGYIVTPLLTHCYFDLFWKEVTQPLGLMKWLPNVIIEHIHPHAGKASYDEIYASNDSYVSIDSVALDTWRQEQKQSDMQKIADLMDLVRRKPDA